MTMPRTVILPSDIDRRLRILTVLEREVTGVLFYRQVGEYCSIDSAFTTGVGTDEHVSKMPARVRMANEFLRTRPEYRFIDFHTHTEETVRRYGPYYARNFSLPDMEENRRNLSDDRAYIAMLVTPDTKLVYGADAPRLEVIDENKLPRYAERKAMVRESLDDIARRFGYDTSDMRVD